MFDLIRSNVVDIIKPEEFYYLIKEGIIYHDIDMIHLQSLWIDVTHLYM